MSRTMKCSRNSSANMINPHTGVSGTKAVLAALIGCGLVAQAYGETVLFSDTFTVSGNTPDVNFENGAGRQNGGTLGVINYTEAGPGTLSQVGHALCPGQLLLVGSSTEGQGYVSPDHNFSENPGLGSASFIRFNADPVLPGGEQLPEDWVGITLGTSLANRNAYIYLTDGFGIVFRGNGGFAAFDGVSLIGSGSYTTSTTGFHAIDVRVAGLEDGNPWDGTNGTVIAVFADGNASPFFCYTKTGTGYTNNYMTLMGFGGTAGYTCHAIDNLQVGLASAMAPTNLALKVDFQHTWAAYTPETQADFVDFDQTDAGSATYLTLAGEVKVTLSGLDTDLDGFYNRGGVANGGSLTFAGIYNDFAFKNGSTSPQSLTLTLSGRGIAAWERYKLTFYSYDHDASGGNHSVMFAGGSGTTGSAGPLVYTCGQAPTSNSSYAVTGVFQADATGTLTLSAVDSFSGVLTGIRLNGFEITAEPIPPALKVDFQNTTTAGAPETQAGFFDFNESDAGSATYLTLAGEVKVTLSGMDAQLGGFYNRGGVVNGGSLTFAGIYNDFAFTNGPSPQSLTLTLSGRGIAARERYKLTFYSYDHEASGGNHSVLFAGGSETTGSAGPLLYTCGQAPTSNSAYSVTGVFKADATGTLTLSIADTFSGNSGNTGVRLNAFEMTAEPPLPKGTLICIF